MSSTRGSSAGEPFEILARGPWTEERLRARVVPRIPARSPGAAGVLAAAWTRALERARSAGHSLWAGPVLGLSAWRQGAAGLELDLHETDYGEFVGTNQNPAYLAFPRSEASRADALGISVVLLSGEDVVLHRRGPGVFEWPLLIDTPGGHMEPGKHLAGGAPSPFATAADELESELGLGAHEVRGLVAIGLARIVPTEKPQLVLAARTDASPGELRDRVRAARESFETHELAPVALERLASLDPATLTPAGRAAVRLALEARAFLPP